MNEIKTGDEYQVMEIYNDGSLLCANAKNTEGKKLKRIEIQPIKLNSSLLMKKYSLLLIFILSLLMTSSCDSLFDSDVYVCTGSGAYAYHSSSGCRGLGNCNASIKSVSVSEASSMGRKPCKICY